MPDIWPGPPLATCQVKTEASCQSNGIGRGGRALSDDSRGDAVCRRGVASRAQLEANRPQAEQLRAELEALRSGLVPAAAHAAQEPRPHGSRPSLLICKNNARARQLLAREDG